MINKLFPAQIDNRYRGHPVGLAVFVLVIVAKGGQAIQSIIHTRATATGPDAINLAGLSDAQIDETLSLFAVLGLYGLILPLLSLVILFRWRALVPFAYVSFILFYLGNRLLHAVHPSFAHEKASFGAYVNLAIIIVTAVGLLLSLKGSDPSRPD